ncbi:MAG: hypothetical protein M1827_005453 [Pycnora praestabilis]|nr:MAG: hypothetical protein M1827_005453 [Pycnora praestabilis]
MELPNSMDASPIERSIAGGYRLPWILPALPLSQRVSYFIRLWLLKAAIHVYLGCLRTFWPKPKSTRPVFTKTYACCPRLENRVHLPRSYKPEKLLPLYIDIHGGGFAIFDPQMDDGFCSELANRLNICVVSISYRKAPWWPFPTAVHDAALITQAILMDETLPIDTSKVAAGGGSAGGNIALAMSQIEALRGMIKGIVAFYPVVDFSIPEVQKLESRPKPHRKDPLAEATRMYTWAYVPQGRDLQNPLLSPFHAPKDHLPAKIYFIGAEHDLLCHEAEVMAERCAADKDAPRLRDNSRWTQGGIAWEKAIGMEHAFVENVKKGEDEVKRQKYLDELYSRIGDWLLKEVYA